jgi:hypothetical protein
MQIPEKQNSSGTTYTIFTNNIFSKVRMYNAVTKFQMKMVTAKYTKILELPQHITKSIPTAEDTHSR